MPRPKGRTRILTRQEIAHVIGVVDQYRHTDKNRALLMLNLELGLTAQEISRLKVQDLTKFCPNHDQLTISRSIKIRSSIDEERSDISNKSWGYSLSKQELLSIIHQVASDASSNQYVIAENYLLERKRFQKVSRMLPLENSDLIRALESYLTPRLSDTLPKAALTGSFANRPFFLSQKRGAYSPNTSQEHINLMLSKWAEIDGATSLSGRVSFIHHLRSKGIEIKDIQKLVGHHNSTTTVLYEAPNTDDCLQFHDLTRSASYRTILKDFPQTFGVKI